MPCTLEKAKALERQHNHKGDVQNISEMYWEEAYDTIVEEYCRGTIINSMEKRYKV